jgi:hypothetical protein
MICAPKTPKRGQLATSVLPGGKLKFFAQSSEEWKFWRRPMKVSFLRRLKMARGVLVLDGTLASLEPHLQHKNFHNLPAGTLDTERKAVFLSHHTLITKTPEEFE